MKNILSFFIVFFFVVCSAQSKEDKIVEKISMDLFDEKFEQSEKSIDSLKKVFKNDTLMMVRLDGLLMVRYFLDNSYDKAVLLSEDLMKRVKRTPDKLDDAHVYLGNAKFYAYYNMYDKSIFYCSEAIKILQKMPEQKRMLSMVYLNFSTIYMNQAPFDKFKYYVDKVAETGKDVKDNFGRMMILNVQYTYHLIQYKMEGKDEDYNKALEFTKTINDIAEIPTFNLSKKIRMLMFGDYIEILLYKPTAENIAKAKSLKEKMDVYSKRMKDPVSLRINQYVLGRYYNNIGDYDMAEKSYLKCLEYCKDEEKGSFNTYMAMNNLAFFYRENDQLDKAMEYIKKSNSVLDDIDELGKTAKIKFVEAYYNNEEKKLDLAKLEQKNTQYAWLTGVAVVMLGLIVSSIVFIRKSYRFKIRFAEQKAELLKAEILKNETQTKLEQEEHQKLILEQEYLKLRESELQREKQENDSKIEENTKLINDIKTNVQTDKNKDLQSLLKKASVTIDELDTLQNITDNVDKALYEELEAQANQKFSKTERKYIACMYLGMDNEQISKTLKADQNTIRVNKYRMRQKLTLDKDVDLQSYIQNFKFDSN